MRKCLTKCIRLFEFGAVQQCVYLLDLVKIFQKSMYFQKPVSIQSRTGLLKFAKH